MRMNKGLGNILIVIGILMILFLLIMSYISNYIYEKNISYAWKLADKSSSLDAKSKYIDEFINNLEREKFSEYNALILKTPDNNIQNNINAINTLRNRLNEIKDLDPESFAYQTAIQQITEQEQGEAYEMLSVIREGWILNNYFYLWNWIYSLIYGISILLIVYGFSIRIGGFRHILYEKEEK